MTTPARDLWGDRFNENEQTLLAPFVTDLDQSVFGLRNLPEVVKGALFSRYSRSDKSLRRILLDEFINAPESGFAAIVGSARETGTEQLVATQQAEAFYERVLIGYGDDSVAELGGAHLACEGISNIAAKALEDSRIGISPLEKSTRYVVFNRKRDGRYHYLREPALMTSCHADRYEATLDHLFDTYSSLLEPTMAFVRERTPRDEQTSERAYNSATRAKACDVLRGLLPMATLTNVGLFGNGRAFEYLLTKLYASPFDELRDLAGSMQHALDVLIPSFVKRAKNERGQAYQQYLRDARERVAGLADKYVPQPNSSQAPAQSAVQLVEYDPHAEAKVVAVILYPYLDLPLTAAREIVDQLAAEERLTLLRAYVGDRQNRFHRPGRAFEEAYYTFDILADLGAYRDMQRHRMLTQERQDYTVRHGFITPSELIEAGLSGRYNAALEQAAEAFDIVVTDLPEPAQYVVPMAFRVRWRIMLNLRELYHLCELRSAPQGHPTYRAIAQSMYTQVRDVHPTLAEGMRFVDMYEYALERIDAERRLDAKLTQKTV
ncbi:MAG: thymidylate synthase [Chloroflexi bacterium AL-W]|nr:thymidylate synthase [Chloroflexi bacterium AL-N1]NOK70508.1 thymidylate synthase [Chloroflexi bacterium AL-N10]NOK78133.1 thymidylate synthase [Chloroflexi bacterium AL-N5]NOK85232.1 thymidylate synthase [Chloroflexi bacterium AL-W]NOK91997.1 thymidylate synthase [Chloroflexi bacterium AL-N15]